MSENIAASLSLWLETSKEYWLGRRAGRRPNPERVLGRHGERLSVWYLRKSGYIIWHRNWRCARGEIDIVAASGRTLFFVEVKTRRAETAQQFSPFEAVDHTKQEKLRTLAEIYIEQYSHLLRARRIRRFQFQVAGVYFAAGKAQNTRIVLESRAFEYQSRSFSSQRERYGIDRARRRKIIPLA